MMMMMMMMMMMSDGDEEEDEDEDDECFVFQYFRARDAGSLRLSSLNQRFNSSIMVRTLGLSRPLIGMKRGIAIGLGELQRAPETPETVYP
eukprot:1573704-Amphidinium_carterae.1